jgi:Uma2 family endonuclease
MAGSAVHPTGLFTWADVRAMPDDGRRYEVIDGTLIVTPAPRLIHQRVSMQLSVLLHAACPGDLELIAAPFDYKISDVTMVEPDLILARKVDYGPELLERTPLLVVEIRSPSTARLDTGTKRLAYEAAGVPWYWLVDPEEPSLAALQLVDGGYVEVARVTGDEPYDSTEPIAVRIVPAALTRR